MGKANSILIRMNSTGKNKKGKKTGYFKTTRKNPKSETTKKLTKKMYDPRAWDETKNKLGLRVIFEEGKIK